MGDIIRVKRGNEADLPSLVQGEFGLTLDTEKLFVGLPSGNVLINPDPASLNDLDVISKIRKGVTTGSNIAVTTDGTFDYTIGKWVFVEADANITAPATITIDGGLSLTAKDTAGVNIDVVAGTVYLVSLDNDGSDFFQLASGNGGSVSSFIKSVQEGARTLATGLLTEDITLSTPVDITKSIVRINSKADGFNADREVLRIKLINSTTIRITRQATGSAISYTWNVTEFNGVKLLQSGSTVMSTSDFNVTLSTPVDVNKTMVFVSHDSQVAGDSVAYGVLQHTLTTSTNLNLKSGSNGFNIEWQVIEFD